ncbi:toprim domain-containing protein [uncultured Zobellia sp.]|uniref:toprim domain-containing protein n=1 Tax=uncultured Zobellia sp. TaxID=255433 RepID=UPI00259A5C55|nr:toprim domain-containing protein [uncultured Zobellia sp.]
MNCNQAKKIDLGFILKSMGHYPKRENQKEAWFCSPLRSETTASFKVCKKNNVWYDFGIGKGGNNVDFVTLLKGSIKNGLSFLDNFDSFSFHQQTVLEFKKHSKTTINEVKDIQHKNLIDYMQSRKIPLNIARLVCKEVHYTIQDKKIYSIGLENHSGGWEFRHKGFKNSTSPKDITFIDNHKSRLIITEGMFDLMSILTIKPNLLNEVNVMVLNSTSMRDRANVVIQKHKLIELYLDNDETGCMTTKYFMDKSKDCIDKSMLYQDYNDLNDYLQHS